MNPLFKVSGDRFELSVPLMKYDERTGEFEGWATVEQIDNSGEVCDVEKSWPYFEAWSQKFAKATDGASYGNVREQHDPKKAAGKLTGMERRTHDSGADAIYVKGVAVDPVSKEKLAKRVLVGLSIGGKYVEKADDGRYVADPSEVSLVDNPCVPDAMITVVKADGQEELAKAVGYQPPQGFLCRSGQFHVRKVEAVACMDAHVEKVAEPAETPVETQAPVADRGIIEGAPTKSAETFDLRKSLYLVAELATRIDQLRWIPGSLRIDATMDANAPADADAGTDTAAADMIEAATNQLLDALVLIVQGERSEAAGDDEAYPVDTEMALSALASGLKKADAAKALPPSITTEQVFKSLNVPATTNESKSLEKEVPVNETTTAPDLAKVVTDGELTKAQSDAISAAVSGGLAKAIEPLTAKIDALEKARNESNETIDRLVKVVAKIADRPAAPRAIKRVTKGADAAIEDHEAPAPTTPTTPAELMQKVLENPLLYRPGIGLGE